MLNKVILLATVTALAALLTPSGVGAWGAARVGYTHVGPGGAYHGSRTVAAGPGGVAVRGRSTAVGAGGGVYRAGYGGAAGYGGGYRYGAVGGARYGYIR
jgi:hypothetical protein